MKKLPDRKVVIDAVRTGIENSHREYFRWSGGSYLWEAPEYLITVNIVKVIENLGLENFATLEHCPADAMAHAGARGRGKLHQSMRPDGRMDILIWSPERNCPVAPIEVKNQVTSHWKIEKDIRRVVETLRRGGEYSSIEYGLIAFYTSCDSLKSSPKSKLEGFLKNISRESKEGIKSGFRIEFFSGEIEENGQDAWVATVGLIERS